MPKSNRDNFPAKVVNRLAERVAYRCSICRNPTIGPGHGAPDAVAKIGKAAHIAGAAPGGPRYDPLMTQEQRRSINNGIWLCSDDATNVDADESAYPTELLHKLKAEAERRADAEKGQRLPEADDARAEVQAVLTGTTPKFTRAAISNSHAAVQQLFTEMDTRLKVETSYIDGAVHYGIHALENVDLKMKIPKALADEWRSGLSGVLDHGGETTLPAAGLTVSGSPVFDVLLDTKALAEAKITIGALKREAVLRLKLTDPATHVTQQFDDIHGSITSGRKSITFKGQGCGGAFSTSIVMAIPEQLPARATFNLAVHLDSWDGVDVQHLPHFLKLQSLFEHMRHGWKIDLDLEAGGLPLGTASAQLLDPQAVGSVAGILQYISWLRTVTEHVNAQVAFRCDKPISGRAFEDASIAAERVGGRVLGPEFEPGTTTVIAQGDNIKLLLSSDPLLIRHVHEYDPLTAFGQTLTLPRGVIEVLNCRAALAADNMDVSAIKDGDAVQIKFAPSKGFRVTERYLRIGEPDAPEEGVPPL